jgi:methionyl-tRNA formyltransferase
VYAGDREIAVTILRFIQSQGAKPIALVVPENGSHSEQLIALADHLPSDRIWRGKQFLEQRNIALMREEVPHYLFGIHFPLIIPEQILGLPEVGVLNLHPAFLPYNRGWHNSAWALLDDTPYGGTLHFMNQGVDTGAIIHQKKVQPAPNDTGNSLYAKALQAEIDAFVEAWPMLLTGAPPRREQDASAGTSHRKKDLAESGIQRIDLDTPVPPRDLLRKLRALTTSAPSEAAFFEDGGVRYRVRVTIDREPVPAPPSRAAETVPATVSAR